MEANLHPQHVHLRKKRLQIRKCGKARRAESYGTVRLEIYSAFVATTVARTRVPYTLIHNWVPQKYNGCGSHLCLALASYRPPQRLSGGSIRGVEYLAGHQNVAARKMQILCLKTLTLKPTFCRVSHVCFQLNIYER
jgi:hypothetical protein